MNSHKDTTLNEDPDAMNDLLALCHVPRWAIVPHLGTQSVAEHSYRVAIIMMELALRMGLTLTPMHYIWALVHDGAEAWSGDISGIFKENPDLKEQIVKRESEMCPWYDKFAGFVPKEVASFIKLCDVIETATFITMRGMGKHAEYAANRNTEIALAKAEEVAHLYGYGPQKLRSVVQSVIMDIRDEVGRDPRAYENRAFKRRVVEAMNAVPGAVGGKDAPYESSRP